MVCVVSLSKVDQQGKLELLIFSYKRTGNLHVLPNFSESINRYEGIN